MIRFMFKSFRRWQHMEDGARQKAVAVIQVRKNTSPD